ncbi:TadE/TadG family type IV pilus assembly protein [Sphingomonas sp.]|uniref:TadE/TadG family type IV pilus assembly protein n=1 Tax=Sphingomonas sp. TaxID=28214 RepID=UPI001B2B913E|nr:TadE/TadG family type IV pilus assembly protein [Sphingomonas sp.]MBO9712034.1 pilus assembly protein [Sphingomonas sp.]
MEFAIVAPVMGLVLLGAFDVGHTLYMRAALQGIVQKVARDASLETGLDTTTQSNLDAKVSNQIRALANNATVTITRSYFHDYADATSNKFEPWTDTNANGRCDNGEPYEDTNGNKQWDATGSINANQGGAKDAVVYSVSVSYPRIFPIYNLIGGAQTTVVTAKTILRNQPYGDQADSVVRNCT